MILVFIVREYKEYPHIKVRILTSCEIVWYMSERQILVYQANAERDKLEF